MISPLPKPPGLFHWARFPVGDAKWVDVFLEREPTTRDLEALLDYLAVAQKYATPEVPKSGESDDSQEKASEEKAPVSPTQHGTPLVTDATRQDCAPDESNS